MDAALANLLESPTLPRQLAELNAAMREERKRRERFYEEMTPYQKVEFINGRVVMHSPAKWRHGDAQGLLYILLKTYVNRRGLGKVGMEKILICLTRNDYEPDIAFFGPENASKITPDQMQFPAPDFVVEVLSPSTKRRDRGIKKKDYAAHGVNEYWIIDPVAEVIEQYLLDGQSYRAAGVWRRGEDIASVTVPGFRIPVEAIFDTDTHNAALDTIVEESRQKPAPPA